MANNALAQLNDVMQRSMLTGVSTSEYNSALAAAGFQPDQTYEATQALKAAGYSTDKPSTSNILKYGSQIASSGVGNQSYAPGAQVNDSNLTGSGYNNYFEEAQDDQLASSPKFKQMQQRLNTLQSQYDAMLKKPTGANSTGAAVGSAGLIDVTGGSNAVPALQFTPGAANAANNAAVTLPEGGSTIALSANNNGTFTPQFAAVWGPDGKKYANFREAMKAGLTGWTYQPPTEGGLINAAMFPS